MLKHARRQELKGSIQKLYFLKVAGSFMLILPVIVVFFRENGLSMQQVFVLQALFSVTVVVLEIPSGYFSDKFGKKLSIIIGTILGALGYIVYSFANGFWGLLIGEVILGFGSSFISGADSALIYDTLLEMEDEFSYSKKEGMLASYGMTSEAVSSILGGFLAMISLKFPLYCETVILILSIPFAFSLKEPEGHSNQGNLSIRNVLKVVKYVLHDNKEIKWLTLHGAFASASTLTMFWFTQPFFELVGVSLGLFGVIGALLMLVGAFFSWKAHAIENFFGKTNTLILLVLVPVGGYFLLGLLQCRFSILTIIPFYFIRGINNPIIKDYINKLAPSEIRATVLSVESFVIRIVFSGIGPIIGWISDAYSLGKALQVSGLIFLLLGLTSLVYLRRNKII